MVSLVLETRELIFKHNADVVREIPLQLSLKSENPALDGSLVEIVGREVLKTDDLTDIIDPQTLLHGSVNT